MTISTPCRYSEEGFSVLHNFITGQLNENGPVYLTLDMDCLDPAFAPGISHYEPGGFSTREVLRILQNLKAPVIGADIVEFNPERDPAGVTAMVAVKLLKEIVAQML